VLSILVTQHQVIDIVNSTCKGARGWGW